VLGDGWVFTRLEYVSAFIPHDAPPSWLLVLTAYVDETGQDTPEHVFLAGFAGNDEQWKRFATAWSARLGNRKRFHMAELRWAMPRTERLLQRLGPIPYACGLQPIFGGVRVSDYADLVRGPIEKLAMAGYIAALYPLVIKTLAWVPSNERIEFIFEEQGRYQTVATLVLGAIAGSRDPALMTNDRRPKLANWRFVPKDGTILTHPADYFAYALGQAYRDRNSECTRLCSPIFKDGAESTAIGELLSRQRVRATVQFVQTMVDLEMVAGLDLKPKTPSEEVAFDNLVKEVMAWSAANSK
jgi:hypothetical protein